MGFNIYYNMNNSKLKIIGPIIGTGLTGAFGYYTGLQQSQTAKEIEIIKAQTAKEIAIINANSAKEVAQIESMSKNSDIKDIKNYLEAIKSNLNTSDSPFNSNSSNILKENSKLEEIMKPNIIESKYEFISCPLENSWFNDLITNFDLSNLPFEILVAFTIFFGSTTSLVCILFLALYVSIYRLDQPLENYYSGILLKLVNFIKPYSDGFIIFYLSLLVSSQMILLILSLTLLTKF